MPQIDTNTHCGLWRMRHGTHMNESWTRMSESWHTYEWVMAHIWVSHETRMHQSCHTYEWVMWMNHNADIPKIDTNAYCGVCGFGPSTRVTRLTHSCLRHNCNMAHIWELVDLESDGLYSIGVSLQRTATHCNTLQHGTHMGACWPCVWWIVL